MEYYKALRQDAQRVREFLRERVKYRIFLFSQRKAERKSSKEELAANGMQGLFAYDLYPLQECHRMRQRLRCAPLLLGSDKGSKYEFELRQALNCR